MSTPRLVPREARSSAPPQMDFCQPLRPQSAASGETLLKDAVDLTASSAPPVAAERSIRGRLWRLEFLVVACIVCFGYLVWRTRGRQQLFQDAVARQGERITDIANAVSHQNKMVDEVSQSLKGAMKALTEQVGVASRQLEAGGNQIDMLQSRLEALEIKLRNHQQPQAVPLPPVPQAVAAAPAWRPASPQNPHEHDADTSLPKPRGVLEHHTSQGQTDYWLIPRMFPSGERVVKAYPYGVNSLGVKVHNIEDGLDYILTPEGMWTAALDQQ